MVFAFRSPMPLCMPGTSVIRVARGTRWCRHFSEFGYGEPVRFASNHLRQGVKFFSRYRTKPADYGKRRLGIRTRTTSTPHLSILMHSQRKVLVERERAVNGHVGVIIMHCYGIHRVSGKALSEMAMRHNVHLASVMRAPNRHGRIFQSRVQRLVPSLRVVGSCRG